MAGQLSSGSLEFLSSTRQVLLVAIKNDGEATTEQLARETFLSPGAVRSHLLALEAQGLVTFMRLRDGPGRPRHMFRLTKNGERLFPQLYAAMANLLMEAIEAEDTQVVERVFDRLVAEQVEMASPSLAAKAFPERLLELVGFVESYGYFPKLEVLDNGPADLSLRHCPLLSVAKSHPGICAVEKRAMERVLPGALIERTAHRVEGDPVCVYRVTPGTGNPQA